MRPRLARTVFATSSFFQPSAFRVIRMLTHLLAAVMAAGVSAGSFETPTADEPALERAARQYRIQVYETFHLDRPEFDARRAEWDRLLEAWHTAGKPTRE